jgi:hypothetical protein
MNPIPEERILQNLHDPGMNAGFLAFPRACDIQSFDPVFPHKLLKEFAAVTITKQSDFSAQMQAGLPVLLRKTNGAQGSAGHSFRNSKNDRTIRISHIPFGSLQIAIGRSLMQIVL